MDYQDYLKVPELLSLQVPRSRPSHPDELFFIVMHQVYELWFKLILQGLEASIGALRGNRLASARHALARVTHVIRLLIQQIHLLETMRPIDFLEFRDRLKPASGFQSIQFREIEFVLGLKDPKFLRYFDKRPAFKAKLHRRLRASDVGLAFCRAAKHAGLRMPPRLTSQTLREDPEVRHSIARALLPVYADPEKHDALHAIAEQLMELDEAFALWRQHHVHVVERIIGTKAGTGGSSGVPYLQSTTSKRCFPWLWEVRTLLEAPAARRR